MRFTFSGRNYNVTDEIMEKCEKKLKQRLSRLFPENAEAHVALSTVKQENRAEITIPLRNRILRAEVSANDMLAAIDLATDALDKQMVKYKNRVRDRSRRDSTYRDEALAFSVTDADAGLSDGRDDIKIEKTKRFALKPMDPEEAVMEMELLGHGFYMFRNSLHDEVNVVYKRNNGSYGLIEPEY
ncbi:MAG: ribosome-associated translation inhibitor RaiA [Defluviitaleaceae bacterium]|nr:ribosome-associated translation inhibitor RaiA [Defluviitaleaceae bacterium]MCL2837336.1 ribosome-associated translation inhibitor RaiA [Defluviitaleaceae bacterium]